MIWYKDEDLIIEFNTEPSVTMSYPMPCYDKFRKKEVIEKPFLNKSDLEVKITWYNNKYKPFVIPKGYTWDGATIPRFFWRLIGANTSPEFLIPSMIHDVLCEHHHYIDNNRYLSTIILERLLYCSGVNPVKRWFMKHSVDNWQRFCGGWSRTKASKPDNLRAKAVDNEENTALAREKAKSRERFCGEWRKR